MKKFKQNRGFSVTELLVVMALIITLFSARLFDSKRYANQALNGASSVMGFLKMVRAKALATTHAYTVSATSNTHIKTTYGTTCTATTQTNDTQLVLDLPQGAILTSTTWTLCYTTRGFSDTSLSISISDASHTKVVEVVLGGGVRIQ